MLSYHPGMFFLLVILLLWAGTLLGGLLRRKRQHAMAEESSTFKTLESAVLALLGLLLGFTFSMAVSRYDQRKLLEVTEANNIGTVWLRTALLPQPTRTATQALLREYVPARLEFLNAGTSKPRMNASLARTAALQTQIWQLTAEFASSKRDPVSALYLASLNDMIDVTESRTAAFENRIPAAAWGMLIFISFVSSILVGIGIGSRSQWLRFVLPVVVASALSLTLDLDSPRSGFIRVHQHSLDRVAAQVSAGPLP